MFVSWLAKYQWKKLIEPYNSVGAGVHKVGKVVFRPTLTLIFGKCEKGKLHILKMVGFVHLRRYYKNLYMIELLCFLMYFYFGLKGYSETLNKWYKDSVTCKEPETQIQFGIYKLIAHFALVKKKAWCILKFYIFKFCKFTY